MQNHHTIVLHILHIIKRLCRLQDMTSTLNKTDMIVIAGILTTVTTDTTTTVALLNHIVRMWMNAVQDQLT
uniref:Uncharacterized protein n=1 Tax=Rhodnius prolixus TaxID=13249 RepID=T1IDB5_RHOPR